MSLLTVVLVVAGGAIGLLAAALFLFTIWYSLQARRAVPPDGRFADVVGARLHYVDIGSGPPIVMVHGLGGQLRNFTFAVSTLLVRYHRLIIVDRPGSGYSTYTGDGARGLEAQADIIVRLLDLLRVERPLVVGHSLGGAVALSMALRHADRLGGLALLAPLTQHMEKVPEVFAALELGSPLLRALVGWTLAAPIGRLQQQRSCEALFGPEPTPDDFTVKAGAALSLRPSAFQSAASDVEACQLEMAGLARRYPELALPVGILFAEEDRILPFGDHGPPAAHAVAGADLRAISGGHMFPLTQPELTATWIRERASGDLGRSKSAS